MILVDTALRAREEEGSPSGSAWSARASWGRGSRTRSSTACPGCAWSPPPTGTPSAPSTSSATRARTLSASTTRRASRTPCAADRPAFTDDPYLLCRSEQVDVVCEVTGDVEYATPVILEAFAHGKDVVLMNAEIDATIGPILQVYARASRRHPVGVRRRRARRSDEPLSLGQGPRARASRDGQREGPSGPVPEPDHAAGLRRAVGPVAVDGHVVRRRLEDLVRAVDRRERHRVHGARARDVTRARVPRGRDGDRLAVRRRPAPRARRRRRLRRRHAADEGLLPRGAHRSEAAALPRALQDGEGPALLVLHPVPPRPLRGPVRDRPRRALPRLGGEAVGGPDRRGVRRREARPRGRGDARPVRHVHDVRRGGCDRRDVGAPLPARGTCRRVHAAARHRQGRGAHLRRRRRARRAGWRTVCAPSSWSGSRASRGSPTCFRLSVQPTTGGA